MKNVPDVLTAYHKSGKPLACEIDAEPWLCEFWPLEELVKYNAEYEVSIMAPGYFGFATSGGGEMYAISPSGWIVCLPFIGMSPREESPIAETWKSFEGMLRNAL